jgi:hypothetical protein
MMALKEENRKEKRDWQMATAAAFASAPSPTLDLHLKHLPTATSQLLVTKGSTLDRHGSARLGKAVIMAKKKKGPVLMAWCWYCE